MPKKAVKGKKKVLKKKKVNKNVKSGSLLKRLGQLPKFSKLDDGRSKTRKALKGSGVLGLGI